MAADCNHVDVPSAKASVSIVISLNLCAFYRILYLIIPLGFRVCV